MRVISCSRLVPRLFSLRPAEALPVGGLWKCLCPICLDRGYLFGVRVLAVPKLVWLRSAGAYSQYTAFCSSAKGEGAGGASSSPFASRSSLRLLAVACRLNRGASTLSGFRVLLDLGEVLRPRLSLIGVRCISLSGAF